MFKDYVDRVNSSDGSLDKFTKGYDYFGIHVNPDNSVTAREWAPGAQQVFLTGDFSECRFCPLMFYFCVDRQMLILFLLQYF